MRKLIPVAALLGACGDGAMPPDYEPAIATIRGSIAINAEPPAASEIRVALIWQDPSGAAQRQRILAQDAPVASRRWPAQFEIAITEVPPPAALLQIGDSYMANGFVVAYRDRNGNERLDFTPLDSDWFIDELVAYAPDVTVEFWQTGGGYTGFHFVGAESEDISTPILLRAAPAARSSCHLLDWMPRFAHEDNVNYSGDPSKRDPGPWLHATNRVAECPSNTPPPQTMRVACEPDFGEPDLYPYPYYLASFTTATSSFVANTCGPVMRICSRGRELSLPPPADWPCPCDASKYQCVSYWGEL